MPVVGQIYLAIPGWARGEGELSPISAMRVVRILEVWPTGIAGYTNVRFECLHAGPHWKKGTHMAGETPGWQFKPSL